MSYTIKQHDPAKMGDNHIENTMRLIHREQLDHNNRTNEYFKSLVFERHRRQLRGTWNPIGKLGEIRSGFKEYIELVEPPRPVDPTKCRWNGLWEGWTWESHSYVTSCANTLTHHDEFGWNPRHKGMVFCCFCGKPLELSKEPKPIKEEEPPYDYGI